jgi:cytoskeletal protein CcmA (bactofilin family)
VHDNSKNGSGHTLVEDGSEVRGTLTSRCPVVVQGLVEGDLNAPTITVTDTGTTKGQLRAGRIDSQGTVGGDLTAEVITLAGVVERETVIRAKSLEVRLASEGVQGAIFTSCQIEVGGQRVADEVAVPTSISAPPPEAE